MAPRADPSKLEDQVCKIVAGLVADRISRELLHGTANAQVRAKLAARTGASDALVFEAHFETDLFVKYHHEDSWREEQGYNILRTGPEPFSRHLVPPLVAAGDSALWLTPFVNAIPFHDLLRTEAPAQWVTSLYEDFLAAVHALWLGTASPEPPDLGQLYIDRLRGPERTGPLQAGLNATRREQGLSDIRLDEVVFQVHDTSYGTFADVMTGVVQYVQSPQATVPISCTIHGDEHANNIMVKNKAIRRDPTGWVIIDYVNVREQADWVFSIAKMLHWWRFYYTLELAKEDTDAQQRIGAVMRWEDNRLIVDYNEAELRQPNEDLRNALADQVMALAGNTAQAFGETEEQWTTRLRLALFSVVFASAYRHFGYAEFAVPVMLGEALRALFD